MNFKRVVAEQLEELEDIESRSRLVPREALPTGKSALSAPNVLAVLGVRRCGKSIFSHMLAKGYNFGYINFDDERLFDVKTKDLDDLLQALYDLHGKIDFIILDEIQKVPGWELFANRLRRTKRVIVTGSNSKLLSGEMATSLTGRHIDITMFPYSFREFAVSKDHPEGEALTTFENAQVINLLDKYMETGGFPEVQAFGRDILRGIYNDIISRDILQRHKMRKAETLRHLAKHLATNICGETSYSRLAEQFEVGHVSTVSNWFAYLEQSYLFFKLDRFDFSFKRQVLAPKKVYCVDIGLARTVGFRFTEGIGRAMENIVAIELQRKKALMHDLEVYYWKDHQQREVDFILKNGSEVQQLVQVTYASDRLEIPARELTSLHTGSKTLRCKNLLVITWDYESEERLEGNKVRFVPLWKWLLEQAK
ncbi:MAG: ATP-binding protein [Thermoplasmata archaeon]|nr:ATP-binding protein [Thermoplasmata archaeon]